MDIQKIIDEDYMSPQKAIEEFRLQGILTSQQIGWLISMDLVKGLQLKRSSLVHRQGLKAFLHYYYNKENEALKAHILENYAEKK